MINGWFVGNFHPTILSTNDVEVAVKKYKKNDCEVSHFHKIATEITVIIEGEVEMNGVKYSAGDIIKIEPDQVTDFKALQNTTTVVVKHPGANNDKYIAKTND
jgi:hypothetical protein